MTTRKQARKAMVTWTHELRLALHLLYQEFDFQINSKTAIFTSLFEDHLRRCGFSSGQNITNSVIYTQYRERLKPGRERLWGSILRNPETVAEKEERQALKDRIAQTARALGYEIQAQRESQATSQLKSHLSSYSYSPRHTRLQPTQALSDDREQLTASGSTIRLTERSTPAVVSPTPSVVISTAEQERAFEALRAEVITSPRTPKRVKRTGATLQIAEPSFIHRINDDNSIRLPERVREEMQEPLVYPPYDVAHPPLAGLLYRFWTDKCQSPLNCDGEFVAGRFRTMIRVLDPPPPPTEEYPQWMDMGVHLNRDWIATPFISTSNNLAWIFRLAGRHLKNGLKNARITVIDSGKIDRQLIYHAQPFHRELCKKRPFTHGAFRYQGMHEIWIYGKIPKAAVVHTIDIQSLFDLATRRPAIGEALRLNDISEMGKGYAKTLLPALKAQNMKLTPAIIGAIADIAKFLGLDAHSPVEHLSHVVSDIISGWGLQVQRLRPESWQESAHIFAVAMSNRNTFGILKYHEQLKLAFLDGVMWSQGDPNPRHQQRKIQSMRSRARKVGLESPAKILVDAIDAAKLHLVMFEQAQHRRFPSSNARPLLTGLEEYEEEGDDPFEEEVESDESEFVVL